MKVTETSTGEKRFPGVGTDAFFALIRRGLGISAEPLPDGIDFSELFTLAKAQQLTALIFTGAAEDERFAGSDVFAEFFREGTRAMRFCRMISEKTDEISDAFRNAGVDHILLKGARLKNYYPKKGFRFMSDCDILIKAGDYPLTREIMTGLGYDPALEKEEREYVWKNGDMAAELHTSLIYGEPGAIDDYYSVRLPVIAHMREGEKMRFSPEDEYVYIFTHFAKHYRHLGAGMKYVIDLYLYEKAHPDMDHDYIKDQLELLKLDRFYEHISALIDLGFRGGKGDDRSGFLAEKLTYTGVYGLSEKYLAMRALYYKTANPRLQRFRETVFPGAEDKGMTDRYPYLKKYPFLLPAAWVCRWTRLIFHDRKRIKKTLATVNELSPENLGRFTRDLEFAGFYPEESDKKE
ncbi:MAG: nucleotidyltransferase family protein [Clostridia bacterium]|nr:nucleotidyltransferase family protein [Clostridia bacterium]